MKAFGLAFALLFWVGIAFGQFSMAEQYKSEFLFNHLNEKLPARVWRNYEDRDKPVPLVIMLHGSGECGVDNGKQLGMFAPAYQLQLLENEAAMYVIPQCTVNNAWVRRLAFQEDYRMPRYPAPSLNTIKQSIDKWIEEGVVDKERVYLIGVSLGAFGVWDAVQRWPDTFAGAILICGGGSIQPEAIQHASTSNLWIFHGAMDVNVSVECSRRAVKALNTIESWPRYTEFEKAGHNIWGRVLSDKKMWEWLFKQRLGEHIDTGEPKTNSLFMRGLRRIGGYFTPGK